MFYKTLLRGGKNLKKSYGEWAIVTGATDGIGKAMAFEMAKKGMSVLLVSRTKDKLEACKQELLAKYPIYCNNSAFDVKARGPGRLATDFVSPTPEATARTIAARLTARLTDPGGTGAEEACVVS